MISSSCSSNFLFLVVLVITFSNVRTQSKYFAEQGKVDKFVCTEDEDCSGKFGAWSRCVNAECFCDDEAKFQPDDGLCVSILKVGIGGECRTDRDCEPEESRCNAQNQCACVKDFVMSKNRTKCLPLAKELSWGCEEDIQCTTLLNRTTECRDMTCGCKEGTRYKDNQCVESRGLDAFCESSSVCSTENAECLQGICACSEGWVPDTSSERCLQEAQGYKAQCEETIQCSQPFGDNAVCQAEQCVCQTGYHFAELRCWMDKGLTEKCSNNLECHIPADGNSQKIECVAGTCICRPGFSPLLDDGLCSGAARLGWSSLMSLLLVLFSAYV